MFYVNIVYVSSMLAILTLTSPHGNRADWSGDGLPFNNKSFSNPTHNLIFTFLVPPKEDKEKNDRGVVTGIV